MKKKQKKKRAGDMVGRELQTKPETVYGRTDDGRLRKVKQS